MTLETRRTFSSLTLVLPTLLLLLLLIPPSIAAAAADNSVNSLRLVTHENFSRLILAMAREPLFCITNRVDEHLIVLELDAVSWPQDQDLADIEDSYVKNLALVTKDNTLNGLEITLAHPLRDVRCSWRAGANELDLDIYFRTEANGHTTEVVAAEPQAERLVKAVQLDTHQEFSRLTVDFSEKTNYQLQRISPEGLMLEVNGAVLAEDFTPVNLQDLRVHEMTICRYNEDQKRVSFRINLAAPADRLEHFWPDTKSRLTVDIYSTIHEEKEDQIEISRQAAKHRQNRGSHSDNSQQFPETANVEPPTAKLAPEGVKRSVQGGFSTGQGIISSDKDSAADETSSVSPGLPERSGEQGSSPGDTPEAVLETLIPSQPVEAANLLRRILQASREKRANRALELIARYEKKYQDSAIEPLMLLRGDQYLELGLQGVAGSFGAAVTAYRDSNVLRGKSPLQPWAFLQLGRIQLQRERYFEALGYLDLLINKYRSSPHRANGLIQRGRLYLKKDRADLALDEFQQVLNEYPETPSMDEALIGKAICLSLLGEHEQAETLFAQLQNRIPNFYLRYPEILYYWARNDLILERFQQGREKFFVALNIGQKPQDSALLLAHIGDSFRSEGKPKVAASYYRLIMKLFPESDGALVSRARLAEESGNMELMAEIVREHPESEMAEFALVKMAGNFHETGKYREAISMLEQLEKEYPDSSLKKESHRLLRSSLRKVVEQLRTQGDYYSLLALLKTVKLWLSDIYRLKAGLWEAEAYAKLGLWDDATATLEAITPDDLEQRDRLQWTLLLAQGYQSKGKLALAESLLRRLAKTVSAGHLAEGIKWQLAEVYQKAGNHEEGVATYRELLNEELAVDLQAEALMAMAKSLFALGRYNEAKDTYHRVLSLPFDENQPGDWQAAAWAELGEIHYQEKSFKLAAQAYEKALRYGANSASAIYRRSRLATCYDKLGAPARAQLLYQEIEMEAGDLWRQMASASQRIQELATKADELKQPEG